MNLLGKVTFKQIVLLYVLSFTIQSCGQPTYYPQPVAQPVVVQQPVQQEYQVIQGPDGMQQAVFYDNGLQYVVALSLFNSWMNMGGYGYVIHHYHDNPSYWHRYDRSYSSYRTVSRGSYNNYKAPSGFRSNGASSNPTFRNTSPQAQPSGFRSSGQSTQGSSFRNTSPAPTRSGFRSTSSSVQTTRNTSSPSSGFRRH